MTLFHWDLPAALDDRGGWLNPDIAGWFADYASAVFRKLDDRVTIWATLNEPWVVTDGGYLHAQLCGVPKPRLRSWPDNQVARGLTVNFNNQRDCPRKAIESLNVLFEPSDVGVLVFQQFAHPIRRRIDLLEQAVQVNSGIAPEILQHGCGHQGHHRGLAVRPAVVPTSIQHAAAVAELGAAYTPVSEVPGRDTA